MYERSAIVLERYIEKILEFNKQYNLKENYNNYKELIDEVENYQIITTKEEKIIQEFDDTVREIENIQKEQEKLYKANLKLEESRNNLFSDLGEDAKVLENKFQKIETNLDKNNEQLKNLKNEFVRYLSDFAQRQKERNKCEKARRLGEANHIEYIKKAVEDFKLIDVKDVTKLRQFVNSEKEEQIQEITGIMTKNGKNEKVAFNEEALNLAINTRMDIAEKEAECYMAIYDKMKRLLAEIDNDNLNLNKYKKALKDTGVKLAFLNAKKEYIVSFLDYERMTAISGAKVHKKMMEEACKNFELDIVQINNLYELILREIANKSTKKAYKELYNKTYLKNIEDKEKNFEKEVNNIKINMGTVINSNYWRIEGIKNVYDVFQNEVSKEFEKDLVDLKIEEVEEKKVKNKLYGEENYEDDDKLLDDEEVDEDELDEEDEDEFNEDELYEEDEDEFDDEDELDEEDEDEFDDEDELDEGDEEEFDDEDELDEEDEDEFDDEDELDEEDEDEFDDEDELDEEDEEEFDDEDDFEEDDEELDDDFEDQGIYHFDYKDVDDKFRGFGIKNKNKNKGKNNEKNAKKELKAKNEKSVKSELKIKNDKKTNKINQEKKKVVPKKESKETNGIFNKIFKDKKTNIM